MKNIFARLASGKGEGETDGRGANDMNVNIDKRVFNRVYLPLLDCRTRYLVLYGGAGSGKSVFVVQRFLVRLMTEPICNLLVVRQVADTNRNSTFALFKQIISRWGLDRLFRISEGEMKITCAKNSNTVIFKGLDDPEKIKSITFPSGELTDVWVEEASEISEKSFNQLDIRLRGGKSRKQIVLSFNPITVSHWLKKRFVDNKTDAMTVVKTTYKDNDFIEDEYRKLLESYKDSDPYYYDVYCLGQWGVVGYSVFNARNLQARLSLLSSPFRTGSFSYAYDGSGISNATFESDDNGFVKIYRDARAGVPYVIGADTAGEGSDFYVAQVLDNTSGEQVAVLRLQYGEDDFVRQLYCLGKYYNYALIGVESNFNTYIIKELERLGYEKQYVREREDSFTHGIVQSYGFKTTQLTRPVIISMLAKVANERVELFNDAKTIEEMLTFVRNEKGRPEAMEGEHDDCVMSLAIAHYIRPQQSFEREEKNNGKKIKWTADMLEDYENGSAEDRAAMVEKWGKP